MKKRKISQEELKDILEKHKKWLNNEPDGERANLTDADLKGADLSFADLSFADLSFADLTDTNLIDATIWGTNFARIVGKNIISIQLKTSVNNRIINYIPEIDWISAGCFHGTLEELKNKVKDVYSDNENIRKRYEKAIELIEFLKEDTPND